MLRQLSLCTLITSLILLGTEPLLAAPYLSRGTSIKGALAYQDDQDPAQFWYLPLSAESTLPDRIKTFRASHFGVGKPFLVKQSNGSITSKAGALLSGTVTIDISDTQRQQLIDQIKKDFANIANPRLLPLRLSASEIQSIVLDQVVGFGDPVQQIFPTSFQVGSEFAFSVGNLSSGFAQIVANLAKGTETTKIVPNPHFGMNITAQAEFVGDPWTAIIDCDLQQVWSQVRGSVGVSVNYGWFRIGNANYNSVAQNLQKSGACKFTMNEGSLDTATYGRQVLEMTKQMFEEINKAASNGEKYFKFEPNPEAPPPGGGGGGLSLFGWNVSLNASYSSASFTQGIRWNTTVSYTGHAKYPVALGTALAVSCGPSTQQYFVDLRDATEPCITQQKIELFQNRTAAEAKAKEPQYKDLNNKLASHSITLAEYKDLKSAIDEMVITDTTYALADISLPTLEGIKVITGTIPADLAKQQIFVQNPQTGKISTEAIGTEFKVLKPVETLKQLEQVMETPKQ